MSNKDRKKILFDKFSNQLALLKEHNLIDLELKYDRTYICPICLDQFSSKDLSTKLIGNYLTEEDAPPASLGGKKIALTCKKCNSEAGHKIDYQLKELIIHEENSNFVKGTVQKGTYEFKGNTVTVELKSEGNGKLIATHNEKLNNPSILKTFIKSIKKDGIISFRPKKSKLDGKKVNYAFLKTNYIITFSKFGYIFLLDKAYNSVREQIRNPDKEIIKYTLAIHNAHLKDYIGTHYIVDNDIKAIFNIFNLKTNLSEKAYGSFLPIPTISMEDFVSGMEKRRGTNGVATFNKTDYDEKADLFTNLDEIKKVFNWTHNK
jgi:hypothetical protein